MKRIWNLLAFWLLMVIVVFSGVVMGENQSGQVTIGYMIGADDEMLVKAKGWYEKDLAQRGIKLKYVEFDAGRDINNAMVSNSIDIALLGTVPPAVGVAKKIPYYIYWIDNIAGDSEGLVVKKKAKVKSVKDLKGKKIATTIGSTSHFSLLNALKLVGVKPQDVKVLDMLPLDIIAAWQRGDIDAAYTWQPNLSKLLTDGKILITSKDLAKKGVITGSVGIVHQQFANKYPELVTLYVKSLARAYELYKNNPDEAAQAIAKELGITKEAARQQMDEVIWISKEEQLSSKYLGTSRKKGKLAQVFKDTALFLVEQHSLEKAPTVADFEAVINPKFVEDLKDW